MTPAERDNIHKFYEWAFSNATSKTNVAAADYLRGREPLVQEVIELSKQLGLLYDRGAPEGIKMAALHAMHLAVRKLADWKP